MMGGFKCKAELKFLESVINLKQKSVINQHHFTITPLHHSTTPYSPHMDYPMP